MDTFSLFIFTFSHHHATHSFVLSITLFHFVPHVLISNNAGGGPVWYHLLDIPMVFFVISQILSNMFNINMYSIIVSNVFGVTISDNYLFAIVVERFYNCKHTI